VFHFLTGNLLEIGYILVPSERGKGYCSEAVKIMVDYLFLSRELVRVQAITDVDNFASQGSSKSWVQEGRNTPKK
jgi:RimJ/RimL family protein N-acetyltransferase